MNWEKSRSDAGLFWLGHLEGTDPQGGGRVMTRPGVWSGRELVSGGLSYGLKT